MKRKGPLPPTYFLMCLLCAIVLHYILPLAKLSYPLYNYAGVLLIGIGIWLNIWADRLFKVKNTTVQPFGKTTYFIQEGPFRFTRHPMYLGMVILLVGVAILLGSISPFICPFVFFIIMRSIFIPKEEKALEETFGQDFINYKRHVRRWI